MSLPPHLRSIGRSETHRDSATQGFGRSLSRRLVKTTLSRVVFRNMTSEELPEAGVTPEAGESRDQNGTSPDEDLGDRGLNLTDP